MGAILSKAKADSDNYEKILSDLDNDIQQKEMQLTEIRIKDRRVGILWILYSTVLWTIYILYYLYALHGRYLDAQMIALTVSPIILGFPCIYYFRKGLKWIYAKRLSRIETSLVSLRKKQKLKVEELKKKTAYYSTKSLLERYDPSSPQKKEIDEQKRKKMMEEEEQKKKKVRAHSKPIIPQQQQQASNLSGGTQPLPVNKPSVPQNQQWYDKLVDALVGDVGPETKYALICTHCYAHNGLVLPQEVDTIQYTCPHCHKFNHSRKSRMLHPDGPVLPTMSPTISEDGHTHHHHHHSDENNNKKEEMQDIKDPIEEASAIAASAGLVAETDKQKQDSPDLRQRKNILTADDASSNKLKEKSKQISPFSTYI